MNQPKTFEEAVNHIRGINDLDFHVGMHFRNKWGLWSNYTPLAQWFSSKEIYHGDDRWGALVEAVNDCNFDIEEYAQKINQYWEQMGVSKEELKCNVNKNGYVLTLERAAQILHGATSVIARPDGSFNVEWEELTLEQRTNATNALKKLLTEPHHTPEEHHDLWLKPMIENGWTKGVYSWADKTHPCICSYDELPDSEKLKDHIWMHMVEAFRPFIKL